VVDGCVTSRCGRGELSELNDFSSSLLDARGEFILDPCGINEAFGLLSGNESVANIGVHSGRVVSPDGHLLNVSDLGAGLKSKLSEGSVVIESGHGSEVFDRDVLCVVLANESVGVSGVSDDDGLSVTGGMVVDGLADVNENLTVVLKQVSTLHSWSAGLGTDEEVVVNILEGN